MEFQKAILMVDLKVAARAAARAVYLDKKKVAYLDNVLESYLVGQMVEKWAASKVDWSVLNLADMWAAYWA